MSSSQGSPTEILPDELVGRYLNLSLSKEEREGALQELSPLIRDIARRCGQSLQLRQQLRCDLEEESVGYVIQVMGRYRPDGGRFSSWLFTVLLNYGRDLRRRSNSILKRNLSGRKPEIISGNDPASVDCVLGEEPFGMAKDVLAPMRQALDQLTWNSSGELDYFAVLLMQIRMKLGENYLRESGEVVKAGEVAQVVAGWLPWREDEKPRRFRPGYPHLELLWQEMMPHLDQGMGLKELSVQINRLKSDGPDLSPGILTQWMSRSRVEGRSRLGQSTWTTVGLALLLERSQTEFKA